MEKADLFGERLANADELSEDLRSLMPFGYTGEQRDVESGLTYLRACDTAYTEWHGGVMHDAIQIDDALAMALQLSPEERLRLIERISASIPVESAPRDTDASHWGRALNHLLDRVGPIELTDPDIEDPVDWVRAQRHKEAHQRQSA